MPAVAQLTDHLGYWLRLVSNQVSQAFARKLESREVTVAEWVVLRELYGAGTVAPSVLAQVLGLTRGAVSKLADRLIAKALVVRAANMGDGRAQTLALTARGRSLVPQLAALADANDAEFFGQLGAGERRRLRRILESLVAQHGFDTRPLD